jgi:uncharacterized protein with GYD domain
MPTYITLFKWTQKGIENIKDSPKRLDRRKEVLKAAGGNVKAFYLTMGQYDFVIISEAPTDEAYAKTMLALSVASGGSVQTETLRAFTEDEYRKLVSTLP